MKKSTLHQIAGVLVEAGRTDLAEVVVVTAGKKKKIGKHTVEIMSKPDYGPMGNKQVDIKFNGKRETVLRQGGGQNFWAFPSRPSMDSNEKKEFDRFLGSL